MRSVIDLDRDFYAPYLCQCAMCHLFCLLRELRATHIIFYHIRCTQVPRAAEPGVRVGGDHVEHVQAGHEECAAGYAHEVPIVIHSTLCAFSLCGAEQETGELYPASKYLNLYFKIKWFYVKYLGDQCPPDARCPPPDYTGYVLYVQTERRRCCGTSGCVSLAVARFHSWPRAQLVRALHLALAGPERAHLAAGGALRLRGRPLQRRTLSPIPFSSRVPLPQRPSGCAWGCQHV